MINRLTQKKRRCVAAKYDAASAMAYSVSGTSPAAGNAGPSGPTPRPSHHTTISTLSASAATYLSQSIFHNLRRRDATHPNRSNGRPSFLRAGQQLN